MERFASIHQHWQTNSIAAVHKHNSNAIMTIIISGVGYMKCISVREMGT